MRIDLLMAAEEMVPSRAKAKEMILSGAVYYDGVPVSKPSLDVAEKEKIEIRDNPLRRYVGRGGLKLEAALDTFGIKAEGCVCIDIGASSGGFTDCLLQRGAAFVYAVDSGRDQLHPRLLADPRVRSMEGCNARNLHAADFEPVPELAVMDVSFISQTLLYPALREVMTQGGVFISLIKPQFELDRASLGKGGIVKEERLRRRAIDRVALSAKEYGFIQHALIESPIVGGDGNIEYLAAFSLPPLIKKEGANEQDRFVAEHEEG